MNKKQVIIIFEGPDFTGKTEISKALSCRLDIPRYRNNSQRRFFMSSNSSAAAYCSFYVAELLAKIGTSVILDRFHISEWVYANLYERITHRDLILQAESILASIDAKVIYCYKTDYTGYNDPYVKIEQIKDLEKGYEDYFENYSKCKIFKLNTFRVCSLKIQVDSICRWLLASNKKVSNK